MTDRNRYVQISGIIKLLGKHICFLSLMETCKFLPCNL